MSSMSNYSCRWAAKLLVKDYVAKPYVQRDTMLRHSNGLASEWYENVWKPGLPWYTEESIRRGAFSTLLGLQITKQSGDWRAISIGDTCVFQIRDDQLIRGWPLEKKENFGRFPVLLSTNNVANENIGKKIVTTNGQANIGDIFVLATDALSVYFLEQNEKAKRPWQNLKEIESQGFEAWIDKLRDGSQIRNDDVTCIIIECEAVEA